MSFEIPFTQYLLPNGRRRETGFEATSPEMEERARRLLKGGVRFEVELLRIGGLVSLTAERDDEDGETEVLAHEICPNGPELPPAVERLVARASDVFEGAPSERQEGP